MFLHPFPIALRKSTNYLLNKKGNCNKRLGSDLDSYINGGKLGIGTITPTSKLEVQGGDVEVGDFNNGVILQSPDATRYRIQVENGGTLSVTAI